ncbi:MAG: tetratricopeptide repeat protein [Candidatus Nitronauta litoralis]|uniref:Tetratricopeptide repeat protein n=1 Tax=Candidatus Nitronauta litoralis TaxID=2705533 RepID=A0A7T0FZ91_9BACT|nr:MAG: tetratricopeptide repeat protein [Candidatus Nitronauta litoralis]
MRPNLRKILPLLVVAGVAILIAYTPASAMICNLYKGKSSLDDLQYHKVRFLQVIKKAPDDIQSYCQLSHIHYKIAGKVREQFQELEYEKCIEYADAAIARNPKAGTAYFMKALCLGKRGELNGVWSSLKILDHFEFNMKRAVELNPSLDGGGPYRALGRFYFQLPGLLGGSLKNAIQYLEKAMTYDPENWENLLFLGEAYIEDDRPQQARPLLARFMKVTLNRTQDPKVEARRKHVQELIREIQEETGTP